MKQTDTTQKPRRRFLQQLLILGGASGAGAMGLNAAQATPEPQPKPTSANGASPQKGYRLTKHIRTYYEKAQF